MKAKTLLLISSLFSSYYVPVMALMKQSEQAMLRLKPAEDSLHLTEAVSLAALFAPVLVISDENQHNENGQIVPPIHYNKAEIRPEEESDKAESCRENVWNEIQVKGP